jgi:hypothetical protein
MVNAPCPSDAVTMRPPPSCTFYEPTGTTLVRIGRPST